MKRICILGDTHGYYGEEFLPYLQSADEIWHTGDIGSEEVIKNLSAIKPLRAVYGNIDGAGIRNQFPENLVFNCEEVKVLLRHITGKPPGYNKETVELLKQHRPLLVLGGHSHILLIKYDEKQQCLFINPGAAGKQGWHKVRTLVMLTVDGKEMKNCEVVEFSRRSG